MLIPPEGITNMRTAEIRPHATPTPTGLSPRTRDENDRAAASGTHADSAADGESELLGESDVPKSTSPHDARQPSGVATRPRRGLSPSAVNFILDSIMLVAFMAVPIVTAIVQVILPEPTRAAGASLWGLNYAGWIKILSGTIVVFAVLILIHLILHWNWVCGFVTSRLSKALNRRVAMTESTRTLWGVSVLIVVLTLMGIVVAAAEFFVVRGPGGG